MLRGIDGDRFVTNCGTERRERRLRGKLLGLVRRGQPHLRGAGGGRRNGRAASRQSEAENRREPPPHAISFAAQSLATYSSWSGITSTQRSIVEAILPRNCSICASLLIATSGS